MVLESFKSCLLLLAALAGLIDILAQFASLKVFSMVVYDVTAKVLIFQSLDTEIFPQHNIAGMISGTAFIVLFSREKPME